MFEPRFTAFLDACVLAGALKRNLLLSLAEAGLFQPRWSAEVLAETERAIAGILAAKGQAGAAAHARRARLAMEAAFEEAMVSGYEHVLPVCVGQLRDAQDAHVVAAAIQARAAVIVTDNLRDFPVAFLASMSLEARTADGFIAEAVAVAPERAVVAIHCMRERFRRPELSASVLIDKMATVGLVETARALAPHREAL